MDTDTPGNDPVEAYESEHSYTTEEAGALLESAPYRPAKTRPYNPHWYTLKRVWAASEVGQLSEQLFHDLVWWIRQHGDHVTWGAGEYVHFRWNGWKYWTMGAPVLETILINRTWDEPGTTGRYGPKMERLRNFLMRMDHLKQEKGPNAVKPENEAFLRRATEDGWPASYLEVLPETLEVMRKADPVLGTS